VAVFFAGTRRQGERLCYFILRHAARSAVEQEAHKDNGQAAAHTNEGKDYAITR